MTGTLSHGVPPLLDDRPWPRQLFDRASGCPSFHPRLLGALYDTPEASGLAAGPPAPCQAEKRSASIPAAGSTARQGDTRRDSEETARIAEKSQNPGPRALSTCRNGPGAASRNG